MGRDTLRATGSGGPYARLLGGQGDDTLSATRAADLDGGSGADLVTGSDGDDRLAGGSEPDTLAGADRDDLLDAADRDPDVVDGGAGRDTVSYARFESAQPAVVDLSAGTGPFGDGLSSVESATGGGGHDILGGSDGANELTGNDGDDVLGGGAGDDVLRGGVGDDELDGGDGDDLLEGYTGTNLLVAGRGTTG